MLTAPPTWARRRSWRSWPLADHRSHRRHPRGSDHPIGPDPAVRISARTTPIEAVEAGENGYVTALNTNPSLAYCSSTTNGSGTCGYGINYAQWNLVVGSAAGNTGATSITPLATLSRPSVPPPTRSPTLAVEVVGAAQDPQSTDRMASSPTRSSTSHRKTDSSPMSGGPTTSPTANGNYSTCAYNWSTRSATTSTTAMPVALRSTSHLVTTCLVPPLPTTRYS